MSRSLTPRSRSRPRRDALLRAAVEVIAEHGVAGTTHRAVTERAGVPLATASYYFDSIGELITEALRLFAEERARELAPPARAEGDDPASPEAVAAWARDRFVDVPELQRLAFFEMVVRSARSPELAESRRVALDSYRHAAQAALDALDAGGDPRHARAFVALHLGFSLLRLTDPRDDDGEQLFAAMRELFAGQRLVERGETPAGDGG
ncbi:DNA-binding transcriptional regulator YbjK [Amycolatopsis arida]|uniref:DNA-binding transcriptional regulator YbjK n=1 Tax=Amycolatopsis arida TaxID=587909 RepID=A0A1I5ZS64_9PSEU|nr:TetR family transcriptional regulator [Amycolatopsis arida]TDX89333.1 DNA-binding transcriptional regulator YbjK [Amycolatopsis arida]SFQ59316.1 DNA-binding transcriptional regulator YbjK [Amycolatopsis arida]